MAKRVFEVTCEVTCEVAFDIEDEEQITIEPSGEVSDSELVVRAIAETLNRNTEICVADAMDGFPEIHARVQSEIWEHRIEGECE